MKYTLDVQSKQIVSYLQLISDKEDKIFHFHLLKYGQTCSPFLALLPLLVARGTKGCNGSSLCDFCAGTISRVNISTRNMCQATWFLIHTAESLQE